MTSPQQRGQSAEDLAAAYLKGIGYTIVTRNAHSRRGEIDIVALDAEILVFVEVKQRGTSPASEAITPAKAVRLREAARDYLVRMEETSRAYRFDLVAIDADGLRHHIDILRD